MKDVNVLAALLSLPCLLVLCGLFVGLYLKVLSVVAAVLAVPTYLAIYGTELFIYHRNKGYTERCALALNLPTERGRKRTMNCWASVATLFIAGFPIMTLLTAPQQLASRVALTFLGEPFGLPSSLAWVIVIPTTSLAVIYYMSWRSELDTRSPWDKIDNLGIPGIWQKLLAGKNPM